MERYNVHLFHIILSPATAPAVARHNSGGLHHSFSNVHRAKTFIFTRSINKFVLGISRLVFFVSRFRFPVRGVPLCCLDDSVRLWAQFRKKLDSCWDGFENGKLRRVLCFALFAVACRNTNGK